MMQKCDWEIRKSHGDRYEFVPCGRKGQIDSTGHVRCRKHTRPMAKTLVKRWRSKRLFADANWLVQVMTGSGWENVGYYKSIRDARAAAHAAER